MNKWKLINTVATALVSIASLVELFTSFKVKDDDLDADILRVLKEHGYRITETGKF